MPIFTDSDPSCLPSAHLFEADIEVLVVLGAVHNQQVDNSAPLIKVAKLAIVKSGRVLVVDGVAGLWQ